MRNGKLIKIFIVGTMLQMLFSCIIITIVRNCNVTYLSVWNVVFLMIGGISSALWGVIVSVLSKSGKSAFTIAKEFIDVKQNIASYALLLIFITLIFGPSLLVNGFKEGIVWYTFFLLFVQSIIFGGIEEIGWRYTFQPLVERKLPFIIACIITFICWGAWHYLYFYLTNTLHLIEHISFLTGLLGSCFILGTIYKITKSLWLCVLYHCLLNVFSQTIQASSLLMVCITNGVCILSCIILISLKHKNPKINATK